MIHTQFTDNGIDTMYVLIILPIDNIHKNRSFYSFL